MLSCGSFRCWIPLPETWNRKIIKKKKLPPLLLLPFQILLLRSGFWKVMHFPSAALWSVEPEINRTHGVILPESQNTKIQIFFPFSYFPRVQEASAKDVIFGVLCKHDVQTGMVPKCVWACKHDSSKSVSQPQSCSNQNPGPASQRAYFSCSWFQALIF